jgi:hypothetical protein
MKKIALAISFAILGISNGATAVEIATIMGTPDPGMDFVQELVTERVRLMPPGFFPEVQLSTEVYSLLARRGVLSAISFEVLNGNGSATAADFANAIHLASTRAPVVLNILGGGDENDVCTWMASHPDTVYVTVADASAQTMPPSAFPACNATNILRVAPLSKDRTRLLTPSNFGPLIRIGAAGTGIRVIGPGDRMRKLTNGTVAAALVAGQLVAFARNHGITHEDGPLKGAKLIKKFFKKRTLAVPALVGAVEEGRILEDTGY